MVLRTTTQAVADGESPVIIEVDLDFNNGTEYVMLAGTEAEMAAQMGALDYVFLALSDAEWARDELIREVSRWFYGPRQGGAS